MQQGELLNLVAGYSPKLEWPLIHRDGARIFRLIVELVTAINQLRLGRDEVSCGAMPGQLVTQTVGPNLGARYLLAKSLLATHGQDRKVLLISMKMGTVEATHHLISSIREFAHEPPLVIVSGALEPDAVDALILGNKPDVIYIEASGLVLPWHAAKVNASELLYAVVIRALQIALDQNIPIHLSVPYERGERELQDGSLRKMGCTGSVKQIFSIEISICKSQPPDELATCILKIVKRRAAPPMTNCAPQCQRPFVFRGRFRNLPGAHWRLLCK
jgi:hypothetical protein